jgi:hypothetical protein
MLRDDLAKVGVVGSNPIARSISIKYLALPQKPGPCVGVTPGKRRRPGLHGARSIARKGSVFSSTFVGRNWTLHAGRYKSGGSSKKL